MKNANATPVIGDSVYFFYGAGEGEEQGIIYGIENNAWGPEYTVKTTANEFHTVFTLKPIAQRAGIGAYYTADSPLRNN